MFNPRGMNNNSWKEYFIQLGIVATIFSIILFFIVLIG